MASRVAGLVALASAAASCGGPITETSIEPRPTIQIQSAIADGTTNLGQGPFPVSFYAGFGALDAATLDGLVARLELRTWPQGAPIASTSVVDPTASPTPTGTIRTAQVTPGTPLAAGWYALGFGAPQDGLASYQTFDDGKWGVRLRPDSHPAVTMFKLCGSSDPQGWKFIVNFSEDVTVINPVDALTARQSAGRLTCRLDDAQPTHVHQFCDALTAGSMTVSLAAGSVSGADGSFLEAQSWTFDFEKLPIVESGCSGFRVPLL